MIQEKETILLEILHKVPTAGNQRDLARTIGLSLGMTNVLLRQLVHRGWIMAQHLSPRKIRYALTAEGIKELTRRSYRFLKKTVKLIADYRSQLTIFVQQQKAQGRCGILLRGKTEIAFLVEAIAKQEGLAFEYQPDSGPAEVTGWGILYGEDEDLEPNLTTMVLNVSG